MIQPSTEFVYQLVGHLSVHRPVPSTGMQLEDTSVPGVHIFLFQLPCLSILGSGSKGFYLVHKLTLSGPEMLQDSNLLVTDQG
jgi:hypothetical protein